MLLIFKTVWFNINSRSVRVCEACEGCRRCCLNSASEFSYKPEEWSWSRDKRGHQRALAVKSPSLLLEEDGLLWISASRRMMCPPASLPPPPLKAPAPTKWLNTFSTFSSLLISSSLLHVWCFLLFWCHKRRSLLGMGPPALASSGTALTAVTLPPLSESWRTVWRERDGSLHPLTSYLQTQLEPRAVLKLEAPVRPLARPHFHNLHVWSRSCKDRSSERWTVYGFSSDFMLEFDFAFTTPSTDECISNVTYHLIYLFFTDSKLHFLMIIFFFFYCSSLFSASCRLGSPKGGQRWLIGAQTEGVWRQMGIAPIMYAQFLICKSYNTLCA